jgi:hypothetical protein
MIPRSLVSKGAGIALDLATGLARDQSDGPGKAVFFSDVTLWLDSQGKTWHRSAASSRNRSRNSRRSAVSPPPCGYRMPWRYRRNQGPSAPHDITSSTSVTDFSPKHSEHAPDQL